MTIREAPVVLGIVLEFASRKIKPRQGYLLVEVEDEDEFVYSGKKLRRSIFIHGADIVYAYAPSLAGQFGQEYVEEEITRRKINRIVKNDWPLVKRRIYWTKD